QGARHRGAGRFRRPADRRRARGRRRSWRGSSARAAPRRARARAGPRGVHASGGRHREARPKGAHLASRVVAGRLPTVYALNFYSPLVADQLRSGRKSATIRLGDKSGKYKKGMVVRVLCGVRFSPREHVFDAVIDKVEVKTLGELSPREIEHDNPEIRRTDEMANFLGQLYNRTVEPDDLVTVIRFSQIMSGPVVPAFEGD